MLEAKADFYFSNFNAGRLERQSKSFLAKFLSNTDFRGSPFPVIWKNIFVGSNGPNTLEILQELFPDKEGALEERGFPRLHKVVLGITLAILEQE